MESGALHAIVVANACTEAVVRDFVPKFEARGWRLSLIATPEPGKVNALNLGDAAAGAGPRAYLDADVICAPALFGQLRAALDREAAAYATGTLRVAEAASPVTRFYARFWTRLPFIRGGAVGAGLFALNPAGRARWGAWPQIISDDTFARLHFSPDERIETPALYHWPMVEGFANLVRVRRRQNAGVAEVHRDWPELERNEAKAPVGPLRLAGLALREPVGFMVYALVAATVRLRRPRDAWSRGR